MKWIKLSLLILLVIGIAGCALTIGWQRYTQANDPPVIQADGDLLTLSVKDGDEKLLSGVHAADAQDGDLTDRVIVAGISKLISRDTAKVSYLVFDSDNNFASLTRLIRYTDYEKPRFSLSSPLVYSLNQEIDPSDRLKATDVLDGDISDSVRLSTLNLSESAGIYTVTAQVTNRMGDTARVELPVVLWDTADDRAVVTLKTGLVYLSMGAAFDAKSYQTFDARSYLTKVTEPNGKSAALSDVVITGEVDTTREGTYHITYSYGSGSRTGLAMLTVVVQ